MRINRLDLHRYGKFTDCSLTLPAAQCDFHMLVGANEAGKSTIRAAILDLLFGIEARSTYDFLHPRSELRLAGSITHAGDSLDFQRLRKSSKSHLLSSVFTSKTSLLNHQMHQPFSARNGSRKLN